MTPNSHSAVLGLDVGTTGARAVVVMRDGTVAAVGRAVLPPPTQSKVAGSSEQDARDWWTAAEQAIRQALSGWAGVVEAVCVDSTSGTVVPVNKQGHPLRRAMMHNDQRATTQAEQINSSGTDFFNRLGYRMNSSFALAKVLWMREMEPEIYDQTDWFIHAADYVVGCLSGEWNLSDPSNCLKMGYDLQADLWPPLINELGLDELKLPSVSPSGSVITTISPPAAERTGLPVGIAVVAGVTDSTAGFLASGAVEPGAYCSTLGTTLAIKGVSQQVAHDPLGRVYCHRHPGGGWLPGAASNVGGKALKMWFPETDYAEWDQRVYVPTGISCYPLPDPGERFPFVCAEASGFFEPSPNSLIIKYSAVLEGVALVERWGYEVLAELGAPAIGMIRSVGAASQSSTWMQLRADVLGVPLARPTTSDCAFGAALLAAARVYDDGDLLSASNRMVQTERVFEPQPGATCQYGERLEKLQAICVERGYCATKG